MNYFSNIFLIINTFNLTCVIEDYIKKEIRFAIVKKFINKLPSKINFSIICEKISSIVTRVQNFLKDQIFIISTDENYKKRKQFRKMRNYGKNLQSTLNLQNCEEMNKLQANKIWKKITAYYTFLEDYIKKLKEHSEANGEIMFNYEFHNLRIIVDKIFSLLFKFNFLEKIILNFYSYYKSKITQYGIMSYLHGM